jgi:hypothetical protein
VTLPIYPFKERTSVPLVHRDWFRIAKAILKKEGLEKVDVVVEPGDFYYWEEDLSWYQKLRRKLGWAYTIPGMILGTHQVEIDQHTKQIVHQKIHITIAETMDQVLDVIVHEVAHAKCPHNGHTEDWQKEYYRLRAQYIVNPTTDSGNKEGRIVKL